jgi:CRISPR/Cas system-associated exonuclease Cas4 (RecB family)
MYQLGTKWKLWDLPSFLQADVEAITLRGYSTEPEEVVDTLRLPADLYATSIDDEGNFRGLSVEAITSRYCPTRRDLYLEKKQDLTSSRGHSTWGRVAGSLIEKYCQGLLTHFSKLAQKPSGLDYQRIQSLAEEYSQTFWKTRIKSLQKLQEKAQIPEEEPERLVFLLQQTAKYELTMLGVDYAFSQNGGGEFVPLMQGIPIAFDEEVTQIHPAANLGLSEVTTPDFIILEPANTVMGDIKTGKRLEPFHLNTITGYTIAYESHHKEDVNFGVVYFFETHGTQMSLAQSYVFVIGDSLRRIFLRTRNDAYRVLQRSEPPPLADDYEAYCKYCKHHADCYPDSDD